jgi:hypothetical protein
VTTVDTVKDFEDILELFESHGVRYLIIGGLAFIYHAKPRYTKDMDLWVDFAPDNVAKANAALTEFGSPGLLSLENDGEVLQLGFAPNRIDLFLRIVGVRFEDAWHARVQGTYGAVRANWIDLDTLLQIKSGIDKPKHQEDARVLRKVKAMK